MHLGLRSHVDAARWFIDDQKAGPGVQPFRQHHLLLVAARQGADRHGQVRGLDVQLFAKGLRVGQFAQAVQPAEGARVFRQHRQGDVGGDAFGQGKAQLAAIFRHIGDAQGLRLRGGGDGDGLAADFDAATVSRGDAEQGKANISAARADEAGKADDFSPVHGEGHVAECAGFGKVRD